MAKKTVFLFLAILQFAYSEDIYRFCLPDKRSAYHADWFEHFLQEDDRIKPDWFRVEWVPAKDRLDCLHKIKDGQIDVMIAGPDDLYLAKEYLGFNYSVLAEVRDRDHENEEFATTAVAVVKKKDEITKLKDLQRMGSCHDANYEVATWDGPFSLLHKQDIFKSRCDYQKSADQYEIEKMKNFFHSVCTVNSDKSKRVSCQACAASTCKSNAWENSIDCLENGGGAVAFTILRHVQTYLEGKNDDDALSLEFLCPDGSRQPLKASNPCAWLKEPWRVLLTHSNWDRLQMKDLQQQVHLTCTHHLVCHVHYTLDYGPNHMDIPLDIPQSPTEYLSDALNYDIIFEPVCKDTVRLCVKNGHEEHKCNDIRMAALASKIRPSLTCTRVTSLDECMQKIKTNAADFVVLDADSYYAYDANYIFEVLYELPQLVLGDLDHIAIALVKDDFTDDGNLTSLQGKKSCHAGYETDAGWWFPAYKLLVSKAGLQLDEECDTTSAFSKFFKTSCVPNSKHGDTHNIIPGTLCAGCPKDVNCSELIDSKETLDEISLQCLLDGEGDIAFLSAGGLRMVQGGVHKEDWGLGISLRIRGVNKTLYHAEEKTFRVPSGTVSLLCPDGTTRPIHGADLEDCSWGEVPLTKVVTLKNRDERTKRNIINFLEDLNSLMGANSSDALFYIYGALDGQHNVIFPDYTSDLVRPTGSNEQENWLHYQTVQETFEPGNCLKPPSELSSSVDKISANVVIIFSITMILKLL